jgi:hypothetical protein
VDQDLTSLKAELVDIARTSIRSGYQCSLQCTKQWLRYSRCSSSRT